MKRSKLGSSRSTSLLFAPPEHNTSRSLRGDAPGGAMLRQRPRKQRGESKAAYRLTCGGAALKRCHATKNRPRTGAGRTDRRGRAGARRAGRKAAAAWGAGPVQDAMTFLCCFRSSVRPVDSWDHLSPEDAEEAERQEVRAVPARPVLYRVANGPAAGGVTDDRFCHAAHREVPYVHAAQRRSPHRARRARSLSGAYSQRGPAIRCVYRFLAPILMPAPPTSGPVGMRLLGTVASRSTLYPNRSCTPHLYSFFRRASARRGEEQEWQGISKGTSSLPSCAGTRTDGSPLPEEAPGGLSLCL